MMIWLAGGIIGLIVLLTLYFHSLPRSQSVSTQAPSILTTLGIFGTFIGVALGLYQFDSAEIEASVPALLDGLRIAFWTSIAGLTGALSIKLRYSVSDMRRPRRQSSDNTVEALIAAVEDQTQRTESRLDALVAGSEETARQLEDHQRDMVKANTEALSSAIREIISEFNDRIEVQYGDNFRQLNQSVSRMLEWQEAHESNVKTLVAELDRATQQMSKATDSYERLMTQTESFSQVASGMESLLTGLNQQSDQLARYLESMSGMVQNAQKGLPDLEKRIHSLTQGLAEVLEQHDSRMAKVIDQTGRQWVETTERMATDLATGAENVHERIRNQTDRALTRSEEQLARLDDALQDQLTQSLQTFGYQLTALSEKFVNDYRPLTERLQHLIEMAENTQPKTTGGGQKRAARG